MGGLFFSSFFNGGVVQNYSFVCFLLGALFLSSFHLGFKIRVYSFN